MRVHHILTGSAAVLLAGCASEWNAQRHDTLRTRASFDLRCSDKDLKVSDLDSTRGGVVKAAGVEGCDHHATYVYDAANDVWVLNALDGRPGNTNDPAKKEANQ